MSLRNWNCLWGEFPLADNLPKETESSSVELLIKNDYNPWTTAKNEVQTGLYMFGAKLRWILS